jgi:hypothetical protein
MTSNAGSLYHWPCRCTDRSISDPPGIRIHPRVEWVVKLPATNTIEMLTLVKIIIEKLPLIFFIASLCFFSSLVGMAIWGKKLFPYQHISAAIKEIEPFFPESMLSKTGKSKEEISKERRPNYLVPIRYDTVGTTVHNADAVSPGMTLLTTHWPDYDWRAGIRLIDIQGNLLHHWDINPRKIWPLRSYPKEPYIHGSYLFPNGDILFNVEYTGLVRLDACGELVWKTGDDMKTHHSVFRAENGNFWVAGYHNIKKDNPRAKLFPPK